MNRQSLQWSAVLLCAVSLPVFGFDSGSTGANGELTPTVDTEVALPADGILHYTRVNIPAGVRVRFGRNAQNTPVRILVSGDAVINGVLDVSGKSSVAVAAAGDGNPGDDGQPGLGGPGGYAGGVGGSAAASVEDARGGNGLGPGGAPNYNSSRCGGVGGSFGGRATTLASSCFQVSGAPSGSREGPATYGTAELLPLVGGSGGAGGNGGVSFPGSGGGGGGGAVLLAVSGTLTLNGDVLARGGRGGSISAQRDSAGGSGGGGSGGAVRLVASTLAGNGRVLATGGRPGSGSGRSSSTGGVGRIRLEADTLTYTGTTNPVYTFGAPAAPFLAGLPTLRISTVGGVAAPSQPTGTADVQLPASTSNPVRVELSSSNVPLGNTATVDVIPAVGEVSSVVSTALSGTLATATASADVTLPDGHSVLQVRLSYTVSESEQSGAGLSTWTGGERVARVELRSGVSGGETVLVTVSGRRVTLPAAGS